MSKNHKLATKVVSVILENEDNTRTFILKLLECAPGTIANISKKMVHDRTVDTALNYTLKMIIADYDNSINAKMWHFMSQNRYSKVACIRYFRELTRKDLRDCKIFVEELAHSKNYNFPEYGENYFPASHYNK